MFLHEPLYDCSQQSQCDHQLEHIQEHEVWSCDAHTYAQRQLGWLLDAE